MANGKSASQRKRKNRPNIKVKKHESQQQSGEAFRVEVPWEEMRERKLFVATPMYGGQCLGVYAKSIADLMALFTRAQIDVGLYYQFNESLIPRARNYCADAFMRSDATHLLFLDADIGFNAQDVLAMLAMQSEDSPYDVLGAPYPKKCISWEKIKMAVDKGFGDDDPENLSNFVGDYVFNPKHAGSIPIDSPTEVLELGTGFMMIKRSTLEKFQESFPEYMYKPDHIREEHFDGSREICQFFQAEIDPKSKRYLSEDYWFCQKLQELGLRTWLCPWMETTHTGTMVFGGSLRSLAELGASPTADAGQIRKARSKRKK